MRLLPDHIIVEACEEKKSAILQIETKEEVGHRSGIIKYMADNVEAMKELKVGDRIYFNRPEYVFKMKSEEKKYISILYKNVLAIIDEKTEVKRNYRSTKEVKVDRTFKPVITAKTRGEKISVDWRDEGERKRLIKYGFDS